jgi:acetylornithine aminotransferase
MTTAHLMNTYARMPLELARGEGAWLIDRSGQRFLDTTTGIGVCSLGHAHPELAAVIAEQSVLLIHAANLTRITEQEDLADRLAEISGMDNAFFCNSGAESLECAFKLARLHGHRRGIDEPRIVVTEGAFHGRTLACLSASDSDKVQKGFEPLVSGFHRVPYNDLDAMRATVSTDDRVAAVLVEPIQGEGGVVVPDDGYLTELRALCDQHQVLLMLDEVQTGIGKTGAWFASQHEQVRPDVISCAKALGNGVPIGACLASGEAAGLFQPGKHGSTYGGNPLACRTALKVLEIMQRDQLLQRAASAGKKILVDLRAALADTDCVVDIRGKGLMIGIEFDRPCSELRERALARNVLMNVTRDRVVRLLPPLIASNEELKLMTDTVIELARGF